MQIELIPSLNLQRELYRMPRDMARFRFYIDQMTAKKPGGEVNVEIPIALVNPMGKEHCLHAVEALIQLDAETVMLDAIYEATQRLAPIQGTAKVCLNLLDDAAGGWTNRYFNEADLRFGSALNERANKHRRFVIVPVWTSATYRAVLIRAETLAAIYRQTWLDRYGIATTLASQLAGECAALAFAGAAELATDLLAPRLNDEELEYSRTVVGDYRDAVDFPTRFACFFGDEAAASVGLPQLGLPHRAGFAVALQKALESHIEPETALIVDRTVS